MSLGMGALVRVHWLAGFAEIEPGAMIVTMVVSVIMLAESDFVIMGMAAMPQAEACEESCGSGISSTLSR